ncbi:MAG TPA: polyprenyl diphosphate synthase [Dongiaceae bacterium]|jgi:undecaprenyl diphosphate synthase|nr:polyprenyl diphosphate synthase [Dongiaceae bacterium]
MTASITAQTTEEPARPPASLRHVAIIMDGNRRWARERHLPSHVGHYCGAEAVRRTVEAALAAKIPYLTLFGFSSENWRRAPEEVHHLMGLIRLYLDREIATMMRGGVRLRIVGERGRLSPDILALIEKAERTTSGNKALHLTIAISYGGRADIVQAVRALAERASRGDIRAEHIEEEDISRNLWTAELPDPDLLIRTSGEQRISNFLLWQCAYAELYFTDTLWPDFGVEEFRRAIHSFAHRERRYGASI